jgi:hypothetical protein
VADFIPLAQVLRAAEANASPPRRRSFDAAAEGGSSEAVARVPVPVPADGVARETSGADGALDALRADLGLLRIAACESFEDEVRHLLGRLAREVLGRELVLAPCDLGALVAAARADLEAHEPLCLVTAAGERSAFPAAFPCRSDPALAPGDLFVEVRGGAFDVSLGARLERALEGLGE